MENIAAKISIEPQTAPIGQSIRTYINSMLAAIGCPVAETYIAYGGIERTCPPFDVFLHIARDGHFKGRELNAPPCAISPCAISITHASRSEVSVIGNSDSSM